MSNATITAWQQTLRRRGEALAVHDCQSGKAYSIEELEALSIHYLKKIQDAGDFARRVIAYQMPNSADWLALYLAIQKANAIALPIDNTFPEGALNQLVANTAPALHIKGNAFLKSSGARHRDSSLSLIKITSGTATQPKSIFFKDRELHTDAENIMATMGLRESDRNYSIIEFPHSYAMGNLIYPLLLRGIPIVIGSSIFPQSIADEVQQTGATVLPAVPSIINALSALDEPLAKPLRLIISAGAPLCADIAERFYQLHSRKVHNFYGSTETGGIAYDTSGDLALDRGGVGQALENVQLHRHPSGRICVSSSAVYSFGNRRKHAAQASYLTSDLGHITSNGTLILEGRIGKVIKIQGRRISLVEIEHVASQVDGVTEALAIVNKQGRRTGLAYRGNIDPSALRMALTRQLPSWKQPNIIKQFDTFPTTPRGKKDRKQIAKLLFSRG